MDHSLTPKAVFQLIDNHAVEGVIEMSETARLAGTPNKIPWNGITYVAPPHQG